MAFIKAMIVAALAIAGAAASVVSRWAAGEAPFKDAKSAAACVPARPPSRGAEAMYGLIGKITAMPGKRVKGTDDL